MMKNTLFFLGQKWSENDVMAEKRKQSESTESLDEGAFICIHFLYVYQGIKCLHVNVFFCKQIYTMQHHRVLVSSDFNEQHFFVFQVSSVFYCCVVFVFLMIVLLLEARQVLTSTQGIYCTKKHLLL